MKEIKRQQKKEALLKEIEKMQSRNEQAKIVVETEKVVDNHDTIKKEEQVQSVVQKEVTEEQFVRPPSQKSRQEMSQEKQKD